VLIGTTPGSLVVLLLAALRIQRFHSLGDCLYSARAARLALMIGVISVDFKAFLPKVVNAALCIEFGRVSHFAVTDFSGCEGENSFKKNRQIDPQSQAVTFR